MQDWFSANAPTQTPKPATQQPPDDWFSSQQPKPPVTTPQTQTRQPEPNTAGTLVKHAWSQVDPRNLLNAAAHPIDTIGNIGKAHEATFNKAKASYDEGDYTSAARHFVNYLIPIIGPGMDEAGDAFQRGEVAAGAGDTLGMALGMFAPSMLGKKTPKQAQPVTPRGEMVQFAQREGVPMDAATASGNRFVQGIQKVADESAGGSVVASRAQGQQTAALGQAGERLSARAHPTPVTPEGAGAKASSGLESTVRKLASDADAAYGRVRQIEQQTPITVDLRGAKAELKPMYDALKRESELVPLQGGKGRALVALDRLMNGPDVAPLSIADQATGDLGVLAGSSDLARNPGQAAGAQGFAKLRAAVDNAAMRAGPQVFQALQAGRKATKTKYAALEAFEALRAEPVQAFRQTTARGDSAIQQLETLQKFAPDAVPQIGRAWLDQTIDKLQLGDVAPLERATGALRDWEALGPRTKQMLFKDAAYINDLQQFFTLSRELARNPNPSGSALTMWKGGELAAYSQNPAAAAAYSASATALAALLHSKAGVKLATMGLKIPAKNTAASAAWAARANALLSPGASAGAPAQ